MERKVWLHRSIMGHIDVMFSMEVGGEVHEYKYVTVYYIPQVTDNSSVFHRAADIARSINSGGGEIEVRGTDASAFKVIDC